MAFLTAAAVTCRPLTERQESQNHRSDCGTSRGPRIDGLEHLYTRPRWYGAGNAVNPKGQTSLVSFLNGMGRIQSINIKILVLEITK